MNQAGAFGAPPTDSVQEDQVMGRPVVAVLYVLAMVAVVVAVDILFFRNQVWPRLASNVGIVLVFAAFYFRFFRHV